MPKKSPVPPAFSAVIGGQAGALPVAAYLRRSDDDQSAFSLEAQERIVTGACASWRLPAPTVYRDDDVSGGAWERPAFTRLRADVEAGRVRVVVVAKYDRFARDVILCLQTVDAMLAAGCQVISVHEPFDVSTPFGRKQLTDTASMAEWYRNNLATEVRKGLAEKARRGLPLGLCPYGYRRTHQTNLRTGERIKGTDTWDLTEDAATVRRIYDLYLSGQHSDTTIAALLNREGVTFADPRTGERTLFTRDAVGGILTRPIYAGWATYHGQRYAGQHPPIVPPAQWEAVQAHRAQQATRRSPTVIARREGGVFSQVGRCACCRAPLIAWQSGNDGRRTYYCKTRRTLGSDACAAPIVPEAVALRGLTALWGALTLPPTLRVVVVDMAAQILAQRASAPPAPSSDRAAALAALKAAFLADAIDAATYEARRAALLAVPAAPPVPTWTLDAGRALDLLAEMPALWEAADLPERQTLLRTLFTAIYMDKAAGIVAITPAASYLPVIRAIHELQQRLRLGSGPQSQHIRLPELWAA